MTGSILYSNPQGVHEPAGSYVHAVALPEHRKVLLISGQIGVRPDGSIGSTVLEQADQIFRNLGAVLRAHDMSFTDVVKLNTYVVAGHPGADVGVARKNYFGAHKPTATFLYVAQLYRPEWLVEIEAIAAQA